MLYNLLFVVTKINNSENVTQTVLGMGVGTNCRGPYAEKTLLLLIIMIIVIVIVQLIVLGERREDTGGAPKEPGVVAPRRGGDAGHAHLVRETGGAPRNPSPRNHFLV